MSLGVVSCADFITVLHRWEIAIFNDYASLSYIIKFFIRNWGATTSMGICIWVFLRFFFRDRLLKSFLRSIYTIKCHHKSIIKPLFGDVLSAQNVIKHLHIPANLSISSNYLHALQVLIQQR